MAYRPTSLSRAVCGQPSRYLPRGGGEPPFTPPAAPPTTGEYGLYMSRDVLNGGNPSDGAFGNWHDRSGNGNTAFGGAVYSKTDGPNGLPAVVIGDGVGSYSTSGAFVTSSGFTLVWVGAFTQFVSGPIGALFCFGDGSSVSPLNGLAVTVDGNASTLNILDNFGNQIGNSVSLDESFHTWILTVDIPGANLNLFMDGSNVIIDATTGVMSLGDTFGFSMGLGNGFGPSSVSPLTDTAPATLFEVVPYPFLLNNSPTTNAWISNDNIWYGGIGMGSPATGIDPIGAVPFTIRLQTYTPYSTTPIELFKDLAETQPAIADGDVVARWSDFNSGSFFASQVTALTRPTLRITGGLPWLQFSGSQDLICTAPGTQPYAVFLTGKAASGTANQYLLDGVVQNTAVISNNSSDTTILMFAGGAVSVAIAPTSWRTIIATFSGVGSFLQAGLVTNTGNAGATSVTGFSLGGTAGVMLNGGENFFAVLPGNPNSLQISLIKGYADLLKLP